MTYRILSLDGGGAWALIETRALIELYGKIARGRDILGHPRFSDAIKAWKTLHSL